MILTVRNSGFASISETTSDLSLVCCGEYLTSCWIESVTNLIFKLYFLFFLNWLSYIKDFEVANRPGLSADFGFLRNSCDTPALNSGIRRA